MTQQVKICPKCGTENKSDNNACVACFTSLTAVPTTLSDKPEPTYTPPAEAGAPSVPEPTPVSVEPPGPTREMPSTSPMGGISEAPIIPPPRAYAPQRAKSGAGAVVGWIIAILVIGGLAFGGWWFFMKPASPDQVVQQLIDASKAKNTDKAMALLCQADIDRKGGEGAAKDAMDNIDSLRASGTTEEIKLGTVQYEGEDTALVEVVPPAKDVESIRARMGADYKFCIVTKREGGKWKVSLQETGQRLSDDILKAAFKRRHGFGMPGMPPGGMAPPAGAPTGPR